MDCNPKYKISELLHSITLLHITDKGLNSSQYRNSTRKWGLGVVGATSSSPCLSFQEEFASLLLISFLTENSGVSLSLALIPHHFYEMMLSAAFAWCLLLSSNSKTLQSWGRKKKQNAKVRNFQLTNLTSDWRTSPIRCQISKGAYFITPTCGKWKAFLSPYISISNLFLIL